jgi:hypothetical protein
LKPVDGTGRAQHFKTLDNGTAAITTIVEF